MSLLPNEIPRPPTRARASRARWDAIVVGSGVGGSVAAGVLAHRGLRVLVLEKNASLGGILASYRREGFKLDAGSHLIAQGARGPLAAALRMAGLDRPEFLTHRIPVRSRGIFDVAAPERRGELLRVGLEVARALGLPTRDRLALARMMFEVLTLTELELRRWDRRTLDAFIRQHTEHPAAYYLFSFLASIFFVLPPWRVSAGESIRALRDVLRSYSLSYVAGGMDSIPHALSWRVHHAGGEISTSRRVVSIRPRDAAIVVVTDDGDEHEAPVVVCNVAPESLLRLVDAEVPPDYAARIAAIEPSGNAHQIKIALRRPMIEEGCMIGGASARGITLADLSVPMMEDVVAAIEEGRVPDPIPVYAPVPTNYDPSLAPPGAQLVVASVYGPTRPDPRDTDEQWRARALSAIEQMVPGILDEAIFVEMTPVPAIGRWMGKPSNAAIANGQVPGQVGRDRLPVVTPWPGLYLAGDGAGGHGIGTEMAARSAMEAVRAIEGAAARRGRSAA